jgi:thiosulfate/3-mercaptopyruvate sulfurtransferase
MADYANDVLVETDWVAEHLDDEDIRIVEVDENPALYAEAHIPGAIGFDWKKDLQDQVKRDFLDPEDFGTLMGSRGISNDHTVLLYGDRNNWFAAYTYWYFLYYGHDKVKLINGPREKWRAIRRQPSARRARTRRSARAGARCRRPSTPPPSWSTCAARRSTRGS